VPGSDSRAILFASMQHDDVFEAVLEPCVPSEVVRRDAALVQKGVTAGELAEAKQVVAALADADSPEAPPTGLRARLLTSVGRKGRHGRYVDRVARIFRISPDDAEKLLARAEDPSSFMPSPVPGVDVVPVETPAFPNALAVVARIQPGVRFPRHRHVGDEIMLILEGGLREEEGAEVWRGDELLRDEGTSHSFVALEGEPCIAVSLVEGNIELV